MLTPAGIHQVHNCLIFLIFKYRPKEIWTHSEMFKSYTYHVHSRTLNCDVHGLFSQSDSRQ